MEKTFNFLTLAKERKTTYEFSGRKVKNSDIQKILEAGRWAPSCSNTQPWHFIVIRKKKTITKLMMSANYGDFHTDPTVIIVLLLLTDKCPGDKHLSCWRGKDSGTFDTYMSVGMAALNMDLEARSLGIDSCMVTPTQDVAKKTLKVRKIDVVPLIIGFGYQRKNAFQKKRERNKLTEITSYEYFGGKYEHK